MNSRITYGIAYLDHHSGAQLKYLDSERFATYDDAAEYAKTIEGCVPTIYLILDNKYGFFCERSALANIPYLVEKIEATDFGQKVVRIWFDKFLENPDAFICYAEGEI